MTAASIVTRANRLYNRAEDWLDKLQSLFALAIRLYLARVFIASALTKIQDWGITLSLFENEYHVPLLSPAAAALLGTAAEFALPLLLVAGLGTRFAALALFAFNAVAVISYPDLSDAGLKDHVLWGALMLVLAVYGPGKLSADRLLSRAGSTA
ncbi:MAG: DoxX family protein [Burkholderiales bacterium]